MDDDFDTYRNVLLNTVPKDEVHIPDLDPGIAEIVTTLRRGGVATYESCQGGDGHSYSEPTVRFHGDRSDGFRAYAWAIQHALPVRALRRVWLVTDGELTGPTWELTFWKRP